MELISDGLLIAGALTATLYCWILSRRVAALRDMDNGVGGAIASLSEQANRLHQSLQEARAGSAGLSRELAEASDRAEKAAERLERLLGSARVQGARAPVGGGTVPKPAPVRQDAADPEAEILRALQRIAGTPG